MKKIIFSSLILCLIVIASCDYVSNVVESTNNSTGSSVDGKIYRKVLIEDYTGHKCGNCPKAATELHRIDSIHHGKIIPLAVHAGSYANVTLPEYPDNFKTPEGTIFNNTFGFNSAGYPNGLINRKGFGTPGFISYHTLWETNATPFFLEEADFQVKIKNTFVSATSKLNSEITVKALKELSGKYNVSVILIEDSIVGPQTDYSLTPDRIPNYVFNHVMRGTINTVWGEEIWNGSIAKNDSTVKTYSNFSVSATFVPKHCHVIAFVYDSDASSTTYYEIKQVEIEKMTE